MDKLYYHEKQFKGVMKKYWNQRYDLFPNYDDGIRLTKELWFSVTPHKMALFVAEYITQFTKGYVLDAFCGGGGNVVSFINAGLHVVAIDNNESHLECTQNNVAVSCLEQEENQLTLINGDWCLPIDALNSYSFHVVFGSPPWGGPAYQEGVFDLDQLLPLPLGPLLIKFAQYSQHIILFLPKNSNLQQLEEITKEVFKGKHVIVKITRMYINTREKGILVHWRVKR